MFLTIKMNKPDHLMFVYLGNYVSSISINQHITVALILLLSFLVQGNKWTPSLQECEIQWVYAECHSVHKDLVGGRTKLIEVVRVIPVNLIHIIWRRGKQGLTSD